MRNVIVCFTQLVLLILRPRAINTSSHWYSSLFCVFENKILIFEMAGAMFLSCWKWAVYSKIAFWECTLNNIIETIKLLQVLSVRVM